MVSNDLQKKSFAPMYNKLICVVFLLLACITTRGEIPDTIRLQEVKVVTSRNTHFSESTKKEVYADSVLLRHSGQTIGQFLQSQGIYNLKSGGSAGATASLSLRGASSNHTQLSWNGFPINSLTLGSGDLSVIPATGFSQVSLVYGASGAVNGSGTFGGALHLENAPEKQKNTINLYLGSGSYSTWQAGTHITAGGEKFKTQTTLWHNTSKNNYPYFDYVSEKHERRFNAGYDDTGIIQNLFFKTGSRSSLDAGVWAQLKNYHIPSIIGTSSHIREFQKDEPVRVFTRFKQHFSSSTLLIKAGYFNYNLLYTKKLNPTDANYSIYSKIKTHQWMGDVSFRHYFSSVLSLETGLLLNHHIANVNAYGDEKEESDIALFAGLKYSGRKWGANMTARQEINSQADNKFLTAFGGQYHLLQNKLIWRAQWAQKFRKPTFNDRYWIPGGNPDLVPETGYTAETGINASFLNTKKHQLMADVGVYQSQISNMIIWIPTDNYYSPENYQEVITKGFEGKVSYYSIMGNIHYNSQFSIHLNQATLEKSAGNSPLSPNIGDKLFYSPAIQESWDHNFQWKRLNIGGNWSYTSSRKYGKEESKVLPAYYLINVSTAYNFNVNKYQINLSIHINNLTDTRYETIRSYPMQGRNFLFTVRLIT
jgi:outer membrane cobalamin receptor